jgi:rfaE bifunctional protein nucleotidyltransferase chain/domain
MHREGRILTLDELPVWRSQFRTRAGRLIVTNGCFDILHSGHVTYLDEARSLGDALLVGLNSDASVRSLKGSDRPINCELDRAILLIALRSVDAVCVFSELTATHFLSLAQPDVYVKGGDYTIGSLNNEERHVVEKNGGKIVILPSLPGRSTTSILQKLSQL